MPEPTKTYEEVSAYFDTFLLSNRDPLYAEVFRLAPNFDTLVRIVLRNLRNAMKDETGDAVEKDLLLDGDVSRLCQLNMHLPYLALTETYAALPEFLDAYTLLMRNYCEANAETGKLAETLDVLAKLLLTQNNFSRLIVLSQQLITQYDRMTTYCPETLKVSQRYLHYLVDHDKEEPANA